MSTARFSNALARCAVLDVRGLGRFPFAGCRTRRAGGCGPNTRTLRRVRIFTGRPAVETTDGMDANSHPPGINMSRTPVGHCFGVPT